MMFQTCFHKRLHVSNKHVVFESTTNCFHCMIPLLQRALFVETCCQHSLLQTCCFYLWLSAWFQWCNNNTTSTIYREWNFNSRINSCGAECNLTVCDNTFTCKHVNKPSLLIPDGAIFIEPSIHLSNSIHGRTRAYPWASKQGGEP